jgi:alkanesulfonate monooxygenase
MTVDIYWRIGMHGDESNLRRPGNDRGDFALRPGPTITPGIRGGEDDAYAYVDHAAEVVRAAELSGFVGGLLPSFPFTEDPWTLSAALARQSKTFRFMIAFQPGFLHPVQAARMSATLQRATGGRVVYNIITGGGGLPQLWWGDRVEHDDRYARTSEFLDVIRGTWRGEPFDFSGRFYHVRGAVLPPPLAAQPFPEVYFSGSSPAAIEAAGRHSDYYLSWLEPFESLKEKFDSVREGCERLGLARMPKFALRIDIMARKTEEQAWDEIRRGWEHIDAASPGLGAATNGQVGSDSVGAARSHDLRPKATRDYRELEVAPNVWSGFAHLRPGPAWGLVGSYEQVAQRLDELMDLGADAFILASNPHLEEAYRVGEEVLPLLRGRVTTPDLLAGRQFTTV